MIGIRKKLIISLLVTGTVLSLSGCGSSSESISTEVKEDVEITIGGKNYEKGNDYEFH